MQEHCYAMEEIAKTEAVSARTEALFTGPPASLEKLQNLWHVYFNEQLQFQQSLNLNDKLFLPLPILSLMFHIVCTKQSFLDLSLYAIEYLKWVHAK